MYWTTFVVNKLIYRNWQLINTALSRNDSVKILHTLSNYVAAYCQFADVL